MENLHVHIEPANDHRLHSDADVHYTQSGTLVTTLSVATKQSWKDADGNWHSHTDWHRVVSCSKLAEYSQTLPKRSYVMVQGAVRTRKYRRDGAKHRIVEVCADTIGKLDRAERHSDIEANSDESDT